MFDFNGIIPIERKNRLDKALGEIGKYGYSQDALKKAYDTYADRLTATLAGYEKSYERNILTMHYKGESVQQLVFTADEAMQLIVYSKEMYQDRVEQFVQSMVMDIMLHVCKSDLNCCFIDLKNAGLSYGQLIKVAKSDEAKYGGLILTKETEINKKLDELYAHIDSNIAKLEGKYESVYAYNKDNEQKIPIMLLVVFGNEVITPGAKKRLDMIEANAGRGGVSIIKVHYADDESLYVASENEYAICLREDDFVVKKQDFTAVCTWKNEGFTDADIDKLCEKQKINSLAENYIDLEKEPYQMDLSEAIRIPFAVDEYGKVYNFELGGKAPAHAMISGSTGSGKTVLLHTIIESALWHYHPDELEIWTIDYKAVEFACYVKKRTPHITVIGQDNSEDFSYSLLKLVQKEYERRKKLFLEAGVSSYGAYRQTGRKLSRIMIVIDEFHNLTQAVQNASEYKIVLENLLSEMRALAMSFVFCSQTVSAGLQGLTEKGINQIGCRLCMKQTANNEITTILADGYAAVGDYVNKIKNFGTGQVLYKKSEEQGYSYLDLKVLYINDEMRDKLLDKANAYIPADYEKRHEVICKNSERFDIQEKEYHSINRYMQTGVVPEVDDGIVFYPGAPTSLDDEMAITFERAPSSNMLLCVNNDSMRFSVIAYTLMGLLINPENQVNATFFEENSKDAKYVQELMEKLGADNLSLFSGKEAFDHIYDMEKLKPVMNGNRIELFFGLHKLKNAAYILKSELEETEENATGETDSLAEAAKSKVATEKVAPIAAEGKSDKEKMLAILAIANMVQKEQETKTAPVEPVKTVSTKEAKKHSYDDSEVLGIMMKLFENGPDMGYFSFVISSNAKQIKNAGFKNLTAFEHRIGGEMSSDDAYDIFGSEYFVKKANEKTLVYYAGSNKNVKTIRPYLLPEDEMLESLSRCLKA